MNKLFKIILNIARSIAVPIFNFLIAIIAVKYLGKENWGNFIQILLWIYFVAFISNFGNKDYLLRKYSENPSRIYTNFSVAFVTRSIFLLSSLLLILFFSVKIALLSMLLSILIFAYQSLESLVLYKQKFGIQLIAEIAGFSVIIGFIFLKKEVTTDVILIAYCLSFLLKFLLVFSNLKISFYSLEIRFSKKLIQTLIPFFLIGLSGWLASKIDLYVVTILLTKSELASYQLLITAFLMLQAFAAFIMYPFSKHIYRLNKKSVLKLKKILMLVSLPIISICTIIIWCILELIVKLNLNFDLYILGGLSALPIFFFMVDIFELYKQKKEKIVMYINFIVAFISLLLTLLLIPIYGLKGAMLSVVISQYLLVILYKSKFLKTQ